MWGNVFRAYLFIFFLNPFLLHVVSADKVVLAGDVCITDDTDKSGFGVVDSALVEEIDDSLRKHVLEALLNEKSEKLLEYLVEDGELKEYRCNRVRIVLGKTMKFLKALDAPVDGSWYVRLCLDINRVCS